MCGSCCDSCATVSSQCSVHPAKLAVALKGTHLLLFLSEVNTEKIERDYYMKSMTNKKNDIFIFFSLNDDITCLH